MKFQVFCNNKPATSDHFPLSKALGWNNCIFSTFEDAEKYAQDWLGPYSGVHLQINNPVDYSGYGDTIEIRQIQEG